MHPQLRCWIGSYMGWRQRFGARCLFNSQRTLQLLHWQWSIRVVRWVRPHVGLPRGTRAPPQWSWVRPRARAKQLTPHVEVLQVDMVGVAVLVVALGHAPATTATNQATSCSAAQS